VTITRVGHPLRGQRLRVVRAGGERRKDGRILVVLPDGSPTLIQTAWTDLGAKSTSAAPPVRLSVSGLRRLIRLVDAMSARGSKSGQP
jgi:hypothetical protein